MEGVALAADDDGVAGVGAPVKADDGVKGGGDEIDDLPLPFVTPLKADDRGALARAREGGVGVRGLGVRRWVHRCSRCVFGVLQGPAAREDAPRGRIAKGQ